MRTYTIVTTHMQTALRLPRAQRLSLSHATGAEQSAGRFRRAGSGGPCSLFSLSHLLTQPSCGGWGSELRAESSELDRGVGIFPGRQLLLLA